MELNYGRANSISSSYKEPKKDIGELLLNKGLQTVIQLIFVWFLLSSIITSTRVAGLEEIIAQFSGGFSVTVSDMMTAKFYIRTIKEMIGLADVLKKVADSERPEVIAAAIEFILEGLHLNKRLNKTRSEGKTVYRR